MSNESQINFVYVSRLNDGAAEIRIETNSRTALQDALVHLGLATATAERATAVTPVEEKVAEAKPKKAKAAKPEAVTDVVAKEEVKAEEPAPAVEAAAQEPEPEVATPEAAAKATVSVEEAAAAVRAFGAKNGLQAARDLLAQFGFARTTEVTADKAADVLAAASL